MPRNLSRLILVSALCLSVGIEIFAGYCETKSSSAAVVAAPASLPVKEINGYRNWTKINPDPQRMADRAAVLCAPAFTPKEDGPANPHRQKYVTVYVNETGRQAMLEQIRPAFPVGSVIVKEKLSEISSRAPELLTVMIKRGKGFNPPSGDWEYMIVDGTGTNVTAQGKLENCQSCHTAKPETDYVFRTYLPREVLGKLK